MLLFTPGPTPTPNIIQQAMINNTIHHRTKEFEKHFIFCRKKLIELLNMQEIIMLSCSGSGAMEACVKTFCKKTLCINSGKFGERFIQIAKSNNINYIDINNKSNTTPNIKSIINILKSNNNIDSICVQTCESSSGLRHNVEEIAFNIKAINKNILIIVDGISSIGVEKIDTTNIDVLIGCSQKAFMLPPGMSFIGLSNLAIKIIENSDIGFYFNLNNELKNQRNNNTSFTPPTTIILGLSKYFETMKINDIYKHTKARALATQESLKSIGLKIYPNNPSLSMTVIYNENSIHIREILKTKYKIIIANGQGELKNKIFRINHMGIIPIYEALWVVNAIELTLENLNIRKFDNTANKIFLKNYYKYL